MEKEGIVKHSKRIKIGAAVGALVLAIATPVAMAQAGDDDLGDLDAGAEGLICFEVGDHFGGSFGFEGDWPFEGDFPFEGMPGEEFGFEGEWFLELDDGEFPRGFEFEFEGELLPVMDEMLDLVNEEAMALAEHLENAGIEHEVVTGPMGVVWVEWDFSDPAANEAVEEFIIENGGFIDMAVEILPFDDLPLGIGEIPFGFDDLPFGIDGIPFGVEWPAIRPPGSRRRLRWGAVENGRGIPGLLRGHGVERRVLRRDDVWGTVRSRDRLCRNDRSSSGPNQR